MIDHATIANTVRKRLEPYLGSGFAGFSRLLPVSHFDNVLVQQYLDATGVAIAVEIGGVVFGLTRKLPKQPEHKDVVNAVDYFVEMIKKIRVNPAAARQWNGAYAQ